MLFCRRTFPRPEYYQDHQKMNALDEDIDDIHNELAHLMDEWEELSSD